MTEKFEHPLVTVDVLIFSIQDSRLKIVLIKRGIDPFKGSWAIPGGFVRIGETLEDAAIRELVEETGVKDVYLEQLYTFGDPERDPRSRVITVAYFALVDSEMVHLKAASDAKAVGWFDANKLSNLAFDHKKIAGYAIDRIQSKIEYSNIVRGLLPKRFRLSELQKVYEVILGHPLDKRNFRKKMLSLGLLKETGQKEIDGAHRPAMLFEFTTKNLVVFD